VHHFLQFVQFVQIISMYYIYSTAQHSSTYDEKLKRDAILSNGQSP
jgi:hypothetical protein